MIALLAALALQAEAPRPVRPCQVPMIEDCYSQAHHACMEKAVATVDMLDCIGAERRRWDRGLNDTYREALGRLNPRQQAKLRAAQRAWIAYRDARCASFLDQDWGSLARVTAADCLLTMTIERERDLMDHPPVSDPG